MTARLGSSAVRFHAKSMIPMAAIMLLFSLQSSMGAPQQGGAQLIVSEQADGSFSDKFFAQSIFGMVNNGDVFFGVSNSALLYWNATSGTRTRLLQANDAMPGYPGSVLKVVANPFGMRSGGHVAMRGTSCTSDSR